MTIQKALDDNKETSVAYHKFKQAIKRPTTLRAYNHAVDRFMILCNFQSYDDAIKLTTENVHGLLEHYVISLKNLSFQTANQRLVPNDETDLDNTSLEGMNLSFPGC